MKRSFDVTVVFDVGSSRKKGVVSQYKKRELTERQIEERQILFRNYDLGIKLLDYVVPCLYFRGYEGDELIYNLIFTERFHFNKDYEYIIHTVDSDLLQLVNNKIKVYLINKEKLVDERNFKKVVGYGKVDFILSKVLLGDSSDNIQPVITKREWIEFSKDKEELFNLLLKENKLGCFVKNVYLVFFSVDERLIEYIIAKLKSWRKDYISFRKEIVKNKLEMLLDFCFI